MMHRHSSGLLWTSALVLVLAVGVVGCARQVQLESTREGERDPGAAAAPVGTSTTRAATLDASTLDPAISAAAELAVVPATAATMGVPPLPRTAAPPTAPPKAIPGAAQTLVPVFPEGRATPEMVPAQMPPGIPIRADAGAAKR